MDIIQWNQYSSVLLEMTRTCSLDYFFLFLIALGQRYMGSFYLCVGFVLIFGSLNVTVLSLSGESLIKHNWTVFGKLQSLCFETTTK